MAVFKSPARLQTASARTLGEGTIFLHLPRGLDRPQPATGTMSLTTWTPSDDPAASLILDDGTTLPIGVSRDALSDCSRNRVLRFSVQWPGRPANEHAARSTQHSALSTDETRES